MRAHRAAKSATAALAGEAGVTGGSPLQIAVIGAGPVGLALALKAARALPQSSTTLFDA